MSLAIVNSYMSCGVKIVYDLDLSRTTNERAIEIGNYHFDPTRLRTPAAMYAFSDNEANRRGHDLAQLFKENELGEITETGFHVNPNSNNKIKVWIFAPDNDKFKTWFKMAVKG